MRSAILSLVAIGLVASGCTSKSERAWRTTTAQRPRAADDSLRVRVNLSAGALRLHPAENAQLYDYSLRYDASQYRTARTFDTASRTLTLRVDAGRRTLRALTDRDKETARLALALARGVPLDVGLHLGAVDAELDLGGLAVDALTVESAASATELRFSTPNARRMRTLRFDVGAAAIDAMGVGNANVERLEVECGAGAVTLDFSGAWEGDIDARVRVRLGAVTLRVPRDVGVRAQANLTIGSFDREDFRERDGMHYSANWESAARRLTIDASMIIGTLEIERIE